MSVTRGTFLKALGKSLPGLILGSGVVTATHQILRKTAAASGAKDWPSASEKKQDFAKETKFELIKQGPTEGNRVAFTFDDGPTPGVTDLILDELKQRNLHATFFMIGRQIAQYPDLARRALAEGHEIGNHTYTHPNLTELPDKQVEEELEKTHDILGKELNHQAKWFRPPYGALRQNQGSFLAKRGLGIILWSVDTRDWSQPGEEEIVGSVLQGSQAGSIILCHDLHRQTADSVGRMVDGLQERGFSVGTLTALLG